MGSIEFLCLTISRKLIKNAFNNIIKSVKLNCRKNFFTTILLFYRGFTTNYLHMHPFLRERKKDHSKSAGKRLVTSSCFEYYSRFTYTWCSCILYIYPKSKRIWSIVKKSLENVALYSTHTRKRLRKPSKRECRDPEGFRTRMSSGIELDSRYAAGDAPIRRGMWTRDSSRRNERGPQHLRA